MTRSSRPAAAPTSAATPTPDVDKLVEKTTTDSSDAAMQKYSEALAKDLPVIWLPEPDYQVSVVKSGLGGFAQDSLANFHPAMWKWTKK